MKKCKISTKKDKNQKLKSVNIKVRLTTDTNILVKAL